MFFKQHTMPLDHECAIVFCNKLIAQMLGISPESMLGRLLSDFLVPEDKLLLNLVKSLLDVATIESRKFVLNKEMVNIRYFDSASLRRLWRDLTNIGRNGIRGQLSSNFLHSRLRRTPDIFKNDF